MRICPGARLLHVFCQSSLDNMYTITCARFDKNSLQNPSPDGTPARHRRDILLIVYYVLFSFERAFYTPSVKARLIICILLPALALTKSVAKFIARRHIRTTPTRYFNIFFSVCKFYTPFAKARLISGVTAALVGYRLSILVTKCKAYTAVAPRL